MSKNSASLTRTERNQGMGAVLRNPALFVLWLSEALSLIGDRLIVVVLVTLVYERTHSPVAVAILMLLKAIPALTLGSIAGAFVDRWNRKWIMIGSNLIQCLLVLLIPATESFFVIMAVYFVMAVVNQFFQPARMATIPDLVPQQALLAANSLFSIAFVGAIAIGPAIGGWITEQFGTSAAFYTDAATFLVPAIAVSFLAIPRARSVPSSRSVGAEWKEGLSFVRTQPELMTALILTSVVFLTVGTVSVLGVVVARSIPNVGAGGYGLMMSSMGTGMLIGAIGVGAFGRRFDRSRMSAVGAMFAGLSILLLPWITQIHQGIILSALQGLGVVIVQANSQTIFQSVSVEFRGRIGGLAQTSMGASSLIATALAGFLAEYLGVQFVLIGVGLSALVVGVITISRSRAANPAKNKQEVGKQ